MERKGDGAKVKGSNFNVKTEGGGGFFCFLVLVISFMIDSFAEAK